MKLLLSNLKPELFLPQPIDLKSIPLAGLTAALCQVFGKGYLFVEYVFNNPHQ